MGFYLLAIQIFFILMSVFLTANGEKDEIAKCAICATEAPVRKVMNGTEVDVGEYPWIVALSRKDKDNFCTGSIISSKFILTATHCLIREEMKQNKECLVSMMPQFCYMSEVDIWIGLKNLKDWKLVQVERLIPHPAFSSETFHNDIALIELKEAIQCDLTLKPLCLPEKDLSQIAQDLLIAGYGFSRPGVLSNEKLTEGVVKQFPQKECNMNEPDYANLLCAKGEQTNQGSCIGDSGSAMFKKENKTFYGIGITSNGPLVCSSVGQGVTYTNIYKYMSWIKAYETHLPKPRKYQRFTDFPSDTFEVPQYDAGTLAAPLSVSVSIGASYPVTRILGEPPAYSGTSNTGTFGAPPPVLKNLGVPHSYPATFEVPYSYPGALGVPHSYPGALGVPHSYPGALGVPPSYPGSRGVPQSFPGSLGVPQSYPGSLGVAPSYPGAFGVPHSYPGSLGVPRPDPGLLGVPKNDPRNIGAPHPGQGTSGILQPVSGIQKFPYPG